jgi:transmembrane sensor
MKENDFILLVFKQLSGDITTAESSLLSDWISQSPENERLAAEYSLIWEKSGSYQKTFNPNLEADFAKVMARIRAEQQPVVKVSFVRQFMFRAAAAVALVAMAVWGYSTFGPDQYYNATAAATGAERQLLELSDGSKIWLSEGSSIQYATSYSNKNKRLVKLKGEAYFEVAHDSLHPFNVLLEKGEIVEVLGTSFNITQTQNSSSVLVRSGKVKFNVHEKPYPIAPTLTANQKGEINWETGVLSLNSNATLNEISWRTGYLEFVKTPLSKVVRDLEKFYKVYITLENQSMFDCPHSALLKDQSIESVLEGLAVTHQLKVQTIAPGEYQLSGGQCQ